MEEFINPKSFIKLKSSQLRKKIIINKILNFKNTNEINATEEIIGQDKAVKALKIGTEIDAPGYNVFVSGIPGTGRLTTVKKILNTISQKIEKKLKDICYVYNFKKPDYPKLIKLDKGKGREFSKDMKNLIEHAIRDLSIVFEDETYLKEKSRILNKYHKISEEMYRNFSDKVISEGFSLVQINREGNNISIPDIYPVIDGKALSMSALREKALSGKVDISLVTNLESKLPILLMELESIVKENNKLEKELKEELNKLGRETGLKVLRSYIDEIIEKYWNPKITSYLLEVQESILSNLGYFTIKNGTTNGSIENLIKKSNYKKQYNKYRVNVILDNFDNDSLPVLIETNPSYTSLFGTIEKSINHLGAVKTDFTKIKAGSLLSAEGGFLVLNADDVIDDELIWKTLKNTLKYKKLEIKSPESPLEPTLSLKPEPIEINTKIIMIGDDNLYQILYEFDDDFGKIFKINAEFDSRMLINDKIIKDYVGFIKKICDNENLLPFDKDAVIAILEEELRRSESQKYISTKFSDLADLLREANYWARKANAEIITQEHVIKTIEEIRLRNNLIEEKMQTFFDDEIYLIQTEGVRVGQVNALVVYDMGKYEFGKPMRLTATAAKGDNGIINIEREVKLSGTHYDKGIMILTGYLYEKYARESSIDLNISLCFEQSYGYIEGDSATLAEICATVSSLADIPIKQYIAVTGSMNQKGDVQPVGGVLHKVEGFFKLCKHRGLTGEQGVIIPHSNIVDLMLNDDVIDAVEKGLFHIYPVKRVKEAIEILTGYKMGAKQDDGTYPSNTINHCIVDFLKDKDNQTENE